MNARRSKIAHWIALQTSAAAPAGNHEIADLAVFPLREPVSGRTYTMLRLRTRGGLTGWGETGRLLPADVEKARAAITGKPATAYGVLSTGTALDGGINIAMLDIAAKACPAPVYRLLGGPTRFKARALAVLQGTSDAELASALSRGVQQGYRAFQVPLPTVSARNLGQAFDKAVRARMDALRSAAPAGVDFVLGGNGTLTAGDASSIAASLERFHLLWFDEPCALTNLRSVQKISQESVTPLGFGRDVRNASLYQDLLRDGLADILRPSLQENGISRIRQMAVMAETYYTAVAPNHEGGPLGTAAALHLAASLPNFFVQHIPLPAAEEDRRMRAELLSTPVEAVRDGFASLPTGAGLGVEVNEQALNKYKEAA